MFTRGSFSQWVASRSVQCPWWTLKRQGITTTPCHQPEVSTTPSALGLTRTRWLWTKVAPPISSIARNNRLSNQKGKLTSRWSVTKRLWLSLGQCKDWAPPNVPQIFQVSRTWKCSKRTCPGITETWRNLPPYMSIQPTTSLSQAVTTFSNRVPSSPTDCRLPRTCSRSSHSRQTWPVQRGD